MGIPFQVKRLCHFDIKRLLLIMVTLVAIVNMFQYHRLPERNTFSALPTAKTLANMVYGNSSTSNNSRSSILHLVDSKAKGTYASSMNGEPQDLIHLEVESSSETHHDENFYSELMLNNASVGKIAVRGNRNSDNYGNISYGISNIFSIKRGSVSENVSRNLKNNSRKWRKPLMSVTEMNSMLLKSYASSESMRPQQLSARDRELLSAKQQIKHAPIVKNPLGLHAYVFRNVSVFQRSYELMERVFKVYVYKEGEKPIFHRPVMTSIYASEGWFMKLIEENTKFTVSNPKRAHSFYISFGSKMFRDALRVDLHRFDHKGYLWNFVELIARKYPFWNRTGGADHFVVSCHDWAPLFTQKLNSSIRSLCNADIKKGFKIGKDTSLPATFVRSQENPLKDLGGKPPLKRSFLAFFAGTVHGYIRPILLEYWQNKEPDMAIFERFPHNNEGNKIYREYMKSSKYCICTRGTSAFTPRVVESIFYGCVPVILADNYVPPFFEVLNWEEFALFVEERDIPNLRNTLLSIPKEKYLAMQRNIRLVRQHFFWHKKPLKYDLFHMILHSIWYNRIFQIQNI